MPDDRTPIPSSSTGKAAAMTKAERECAAKQFRCPKCGHGPGWRCKGGTVRLTTLKHPHAERVALVPDGE